MDQHTIHLNKLVGSVIQIEGLESKRQFVDDARNGANQYDWLFHCTHKDALLSIAKNKRFWLTNLKLVNDIEESERIDVPEYEKSFFIASFTYENNVLDDLWDEYGNLTNGVLFGVKREWFMREMNFMTNDNQEIEDENFRIYLTADLSSDLMMDSDLQQKCMPYPYEAFDFGFYKVVYDDEMMKSIKSSSVLLHSGNEIHGRFIFPEVSGIIKHKKRISIREGQEPRSRNWIDEKEVRLKIGVRNPPYKGLKELWFRKISVSLSPEAFKEIIIRFSPSFPETEKNPYLKMLKNVLPDVQIQIL